MHMCVGLSVTGVVCKGCAKEGKEESVLPGVVRKDLLTTVSPQVKF